MKTLPLGASGGDALTPKYTEILCLLSSFIFTLKSVSTLFKTQADILVSFLYFILPPRLSFIDTIPQLLPVVSQRLNGLPQSPFQLRLSLIGSKLIRNEPLSPAETDSPTERVVKEGETYEGVGEDGKVMQTDRRDAEINRWEMDIKFCGLKSRRG